MVKDIAAYSVPLHGVLAVSHHFGFRVVCGSLGEFLDQVRTLQPAAVLIQVTQYVTLDVLRLIQSQARAASVILWATEASLAMPALRHPNQPQHAIGAPEPASSKRLFITPRERRLVGYVAEGLTNRQIASCMGITEGTTKVYLSRILDKVGAMDRRDLVARAATLNLCSRP